jgi:hypothetical protein
MLNQFKSATQGTLGEYIIENYNDSGYKLVTIATRFPGKQEPNWGRGVGSWTVDYLDTSATFWSLMKKYEPIAVMTTSRNEDQNKWVLEIGARNLARDDWRLLTWNQNRPPYIGAGTGDPASAPGLPNAGLTPKDGDPPDATRAADAKTGTTGRGVSNYVSAIQLLIIGKLNSEFAEADLKAEKDTELQGSGFDDYVSAFAGYHAVWYADWSDSCRAGWHTHVDSGISTANASKAIKLQLEVLIEWLDNN